MKIIKKLKLFPASLIVGAIMLLAFFSAAEATLIINHPGTPLDHYIISPTFPTHGSAYTEGSTIRFKGKVKYIEPGSSQAETSAGYWSCDSFDRNIYKSHYEYYGCKVTFGIAYDAFIGMQGPNPYFNTNGIRELGTVNGTFAYESGQATCSYDATFQLPSPLGISNDNNIADLATVYTMWSSHSWQTGTAYNCTYNAAGGCPGGYTGCTAGPSPSNESWNEHGFNAGTFGEHVTITSTPNYPPTVPDIGGLPTGTKNVSYSATATSTDPDGDTIRYGFCWNSTSCGVAGNPPAEWKPATGYVSSGTLQLDNYTWTSNGSKNLSVFAEDQYGNRSASATKIITISDCGNGVINSPEQCDAGAANGVCPNTCSSTCTTNVCTPSDCTLPWGGTITSGSSTNAYQSSSVVCGGTCVSESRTCTNGVLSGTYTNQNCSEAGCLGCTSPWGTPVAHNGVVRAYQASSIVCGANCMFQDRLCTNGVLNGTYLEQNCTLPLGCDEGGYVEVPI